MGRKAKPPRIEADSKGVWYVHWSESGRTLRQSLRTTDLSEAKARFSGWLDAKAVVEQETVVTFAQAWQIYLDQHVSQHVFAPKMIEYHGKKLLRFFGKMRITEISQADVDAYVKLRKTGGMGRISQDGTIRQEILRIVTCMHFMSKRALPISVRIDPRHIPHFRLPEASKPRSRVILADEQAEIMAAAKTPDGQPMSNLELFLHLAFETGSRFAAIFELTWAQIDFASGVINFLPEGRKQTKKRRPRVPISSRLAAVLERMKVERGHQTRLFTGADLTMQKHLRKFFDGLGKFDVSAHTIRHSVASQMVMSGVPIHAVAAILGDTVLTIEKNYMHLQPDWLRRAMEIRYGGQIDSPQGQKTAQNFAFYPQIVSIDSQQKDSQVQENRASSCVDC